MRATKGKLTDRQRVIMGYVIDGRPYKEIAVILGISMQTVKNILRHATTRTESKNNKHMVARFVRGEI